MRRAKQVGLGWVEFRGMQVEVDALDADLLVLDEFSRMNPEIVATAEARVSSPESAGLIRRLGTPDIPGAGISAAYEETSDGRVWTVRCESCGHWNPLRGLAAFEANVDVETARLVCASCRRELDVRRGEWVATYPDRDVIGFCVPKLLIPGLHLEQMIKRSRLTKPYHRRAFMTRDLGEPYIDGSERLSLEDVRACEDPSLRPQRAWRGGVHPVVLGCDVAGARALNVSIEEVVGGRGRKLWVGEIDDGDGRTVLERLAQLMADYGVWMACIDAVPETRLSRAFADLFPGQVYRVGYHMPTVGRRDPELAIVDDEDRYLSVWRTVILDETVHRFRRREVAIPPLDLLPADYASQLGNAVKVVEERAGWQRVARWVRHGGADDYLHAEAFCFCARELLVRAAKWDRWELSAAGETLADLEPVNLSDYDQPADYRAGFE